MPYLKSTNIAAFPVVNRTAAVSGDIYSRHTSEEILSGIVNKLIDTDGFVITTEKNFGLDKEFAFNIHGYYFRTQDDVVTDSSTVSDPTTLKGTLRRIIELFEYEDESGQTVQEYGVGDEIYARVSTELNGRWTELAGLDEPDLAGNKEQIPDNSTVYYYSSVEFILKDKDEDPPESSGTTYVIPLVKYIGADAEAAWDSGWYVPDINYLKFNKNSFTISRVDGGDFDEELRTIS